MDDEQKLHLGAHCQSQGQRVNRDGNHPAFSPNTTETEKARKRPDSTS